MTTITKERIELFIKNPLENGLTRGEQMELARIALASLEAEPVSQAYNLPQTHFEQVADLYEMQFEDGRTCTFHTDAQKAVQWLQACDGNRVQEYVKLERLQNALSGNSPVAPDGYADMLQRWLVFGIGMLKAGSQLPRNLIAETKAMVAALQQEDE